MAKRKYTVGAQGQGTKTHRDEMEICRWRSPDGSGDRIGIILTGDPALVAAAAQQAEASRTEADLNRAGFKMGAEGPMAVASLQEQAGKTANPATCDPDDVLTQDTGVQWPAVSPVPSASSSTPAPAP